MRIYAKNIEQVFLQSDCGLQNANQNDNVIAGRYKGEQCEPWTRAQIC